MDKRQPYAGILSEIAVARSELGDVVRTLNYFSDPEILIKSQKLDKLINRYYRMTIQSNTEPES